MDPERLQAVMAWKDQADGVLMNLIGGRWRRIRSSDCKVPRRISRVG